MSAALTQPLLERATEMLAVEGQSLAETANRLGVSVIWLTTQLQPYAVHITELAAHSARMEARLLAARHAARMVQVPIEIALDKTVAAPHRLAAAAEVRRLIQVEPEAAPTATGVTVNVTNNRLTNVLNAAWRGGLSDHQAGAGGGERSAETFEVDFSEVD